MEQYLKERSFLSNAWSEFSCPDSCGRMGCKHPDLHISISLIDLVGFSWVSGQKASDLSGQYLKIGFDPLYEKEPWIGPISMELKKPCPFLGGKTCSIYPGRPVACALFPESCFVVENPEDLLGEIVFERFVEGGYWDEWKTKIEQLDRSSRLDVLARVKSWTDRMAEAVRGFSLKVAYQFDGMKLHPIHLRK